ncbi:MAG: hypothetical protein KME15_00435 [Drouetiella hepatica Uher 2000/2452]|jgi:hypothetical protein|uniref:Uncharacterized protein n=1 Tax=Drouetiella hepatica Uher 2000/2452 TaxID=904376 RepID=A0A951Q5P7_9CYAN|nr:hypothetical protein [Drouetiella hepatica Uher 2000/2452]
MTTLARKFPWLSLALLLAAYATFSWFFTHAFTQVLTFSNTAYLSWSLVLAFTLLEALLLTTQFDGLKSLIGRWLRSDMGYFTLIIAASLGATLAFIWSNVTGYFVVLIAAEILARLDLQNAKFSRFQSFIILTVISVLGLAIGLIASLRLDSALTGV